MHTIFETDHWAVSHRKDSRYPGFLIVASKSDVVEISGLSQDALSELGHVLAKTESILISHFKPYRVITAKLGFSKLKKTVTRRKNFRIVTLNSTAKIFEVVVDSKCRKQL
jgi:diadenosine tetraphosphate (Ap4A) HIT family hydrolase